VGRKRATATHLDHRTGLQTNLVGDGELSRAKAVALVLHGGKETSESPVASRQLAVLRMVPLARHLVAVGAERGLAVWRLRFRYRGWNSEAAHPMEDLDWAIRQLRLRHGRAPIVIVGHSMGGRAALRGAGADGVTGVVGLAPWVPEGEPCEQLIGRRVLVVHGVRDRVTSAARSREFVTSIRPIAEEAIYVGMRNCGHAMLQRTQVWNRLTSDFVLHAALGQALRAPLAQALAVGDVLV
jgi:pimeloyl-ACP methyl ester carboxylesterase